MSVSLDKPCVASRPLLTEENGFDSFHRASHNFRELMKSFDDWHSGKRKSIVEQYEQGRLSIICDLGISAASDQIVPCSAISAQNPRAKYDLLASLIFHANVVDDIDIHHWKQEPMFVQVVKVVQGPKGVIPSLVRFHNLHDEVSDCFRGSMYRSAINSRYKFLPRYTNRELCMQVVGTESPIDDLIHGVIQRSSQIVERITDQESKCIRNELADFDLNSIVSGFRIVVDAETVTAMCGKPVNLTVEIIDVLFGPLDL